MDKIYCHLILSFDAGYILTQNEILQIATQQIEESKELFNGHRKEKEKEKDLAIDSPLKMIVNITEKKKQILYKVRGEKRMNNNKFVTQLINENNRAPPDQYQIDFGYQFKYWNDYKHNDWYISQKNIEI